ncbi:MAG: hypothetical protein Q8L48_17465 [Archangium sp.]|nr:hypothetical protein [Archangium sp.]
MSWRVGVAVALGTLLGAGCASGCLTDECGRGGLERVQPFTAAVALTGTPAKLTMGIACTSGITAVSVVVTDPQGKVAPGAVSSFSPSGSAVIEFTPTVPGPHSIVARFEPLGAEARATSHVLRDRSGEAPVFRFRSSAKCSELLVVAGLASCRSESGVDLIVDGGAVDRGPASLLSSAGPALWAVGPTSVERFVAADGGVHRAQLLFDAQRVLTGVRGTTADELVLSESGTLFAVRLAADGGLERAPLDFDSDPMMSQGLAMTDGGVIWLNGAEACFGAFGQPRRCRESSLRMLAPEGDGLWVMNQGSEIGFARFENGPAPVSLQFLRLEPAAQLELQNAQSGYPASRFRDHLVAIDGAALRLDAWKGPAGWDAGGVTPAHVWFGGGGDFVVFAR